MFRWNIIISIPTGSIKILNLHLPLSTRSRISIPTGSIKIENNFSKITKFLNFNSNWFD